jgi:hypothetical protein
MKIYRDELAREKKIDANFQTAKRDSKQIVNDLFSFCLFIASCSAFHRRSEVANNSSADDK